MPSPIESPGEPVARGLVEAPSLSDQVRNLLLEALTSGQLRPGDRVNEAGLARDLGISRNPIREAVSGLAQRGFLVASPRRGHFLRRFGPEDVSDVFSFRICVESFAIRQALPRMTTSDHVELGRLVARMVTAARRHRLADLQQTDMRFHRRICALSGNRHALRAHEGIDTEVRMLIASVDLDHETPMEAALSHRPIAEAIGTRDAVQAVAAMEGHLKTTWRHVLETFEDTGCSVAGPASVRGNPVLRRLA